MATRGRAQARRKENKARYLTISSSQPLQLEAANIQKSAPNTVSYHSAWHSGIHAIIQQYLRRFQVAHGYGDRDFVQCMIFQNPTSIN